MSWDSEDWKGIAGTIGKIAPALGTILGGPIGGALGAGVAVLTGSLGVEDNPDAVLKALKTDPEAYKKIKQAEMDHELELQKLVYQTVQAGYNHDASIIESLSKADSTGHSTRPKIALEISRAFLAVYIVIGLAMAWAIYNESLLLEDMWLTLLAFLGLPMTLIKMYFGDLRKENAQNQGQQVDFGLLGNIFGAKK